MTEEFDFEIQYRSPSKHSNADALSPRPCPKKTCYCHDLEDDCVSEVRAVKTVAEIRLEDAFDFGCSREEVIAAQKLDPNIAFVYGKVEARNQQPRWEEVALLSEETKILWAQWARLSVRQGVLCRRWEMAIGSDDRWQIILPCKMRSDFVRQVHGGMTGGHLAQAKTELQVSRRAYWPKWKSDVTAVVRSCVPCAQYYRGGPPRQTPLKPLVVGCPWERISIDITGPHCKSIRGHQYIFAGCRPLFQVGGSTPPQETYGTRRG
mgnify:FL=1